MPVKSKKQLKFMEGIAHGMKSNRGIGPSKEVAEEMLKKTSKDKKRELMLSKKK